MARSSSGDDCDQRFCLDRRGNPLPPPSYSRELQAVAGISGNLATGHRSAQDGAEGQERDLDRGRVQAIGEQSVCELLKVGGAPARSVAPSPNSGKDARRRIARLGRSGASRACSGRRICWCIVPPFAPSWNASQAWRIVLGFDARSPPRDSAPSASARQDFASASRAKVRLNLLAVAAESDRGPSSPPPRRHRPPPLARQPFECALDDPLSHVSPATAAHRMCWKARLQRSRGA